MVATNTNMLTSLVVISMFWIFSACLFLLTYSLSIVSEGISMQLQLCPSPSDYHKRCTKNWAAQWGDSDHRSRRKAAMGFFNSSQGMWELGQSYWVSATEETGANGMVGSSILCCSVVQVVKQEIIANILSEVNQSLARLQAAPCEWWEMCLPQQI